MSATQQQAERNGGAATQTGDSRLPAASLPESLGIVASGVVPALVRGLFSPRRTAMRLLARADSDRRAVELLSGLQRRHGGEGLRLLGGRLVVLWGEDAIRQVLDQSADVYASDSGAKAKGMSHFQPDALTLSRGDQWRERRQFNEAVLSAQEPLHPFAGRFLQVVQEEIARLSVGSRLDYDVWEGLFDRITLRVIFGDRAAGQQRLTTLLEKLMAEGNRLVGLKPNDDYYEFYGLLERQLQDPQPGSLLARLDQAPHTDRTRVVQQIPHWMFAMRDTLAANAFRALAVIAADAQVRERVVAEVAAADLVDPRAVSSLSYLEGCLQEAMRLWPTTPLLARETTREVTLAGQPLAEGTQVLMLNVFNHRNPDAVPDADRLHPERWQEGADGDYRFNHLSHGTQDCPGAPLVSLLGKAVLAGILRRYELSLEQPQLPPGEPLPHMLNFYDIRFAASLRPAP